MRIDQISLLGPIMPVVSGEDGSELIGEIAFQAQAVINGHAWLEIPLNGGRETRMEIKESWHNWCNVHGVKFTAIGGCMLVIGNKPCE